jgi:hypothetical protein
MTMGIASHAVSPGHRHVAFARGIDGGRSRIGVASTREGAIRLALAVPTREGTSAFVCEEHLVGDSVSGLVNVAAVHADGTLGPATFPRREAREPLPAQVTTVSMWRRTGDWSSPSNKHPGLDVLELRAYFVERYRVQRR